MTEPACDRRLPELLVAIILWLLVLASAPMTRAQSLQQIDEDDFNVSYSYAAVMGSGTYKIHGRRISMLRVPISYTHSVMTPEKAGKKWYLPLTVGYDRANGNTWLETIFDEELVTLTAMPGFEAHFPVNENWTVKPFGNIGGTYDFTRQEFIALAVAGLRTRGTWLIDERSQFIWGGGIRLSGEYQFDSKVSHAFSILETGVDYRRDTGFQALDRMVNVGVYYYFQHYAPVWHIDSTPVRDSEIMDLHEIGFSLGFKRPRKLFGVTIERFRLGYKSGTGFEGWSFGTDFPL